MKALAAFFSGFGLFLVFMPLGIVLGGIWAWVPIIFTFGIVPLLDVLGGTSLWNPEPDIERTLSADKRFRSLVALWVPAAVVMTAWGLWAAAQPGTPLPDKLGLVLSIGFMNGVIGITYAHELIHQPSKFEQWCGDALLVLVCYGHWHTEHVFGHHRNVATPLDPASSRRGEWFYTFYFRTVTGTFASALELERARLVRAGKSPFGFQNRILTLGLASLALAALAAALLGPAGLAFFVLQSVVAFSSLEVINYIEHYGLSRREIAPGKYETVRPKHSWNAAQRVSNAMLINLARHSDHHATASRRYQILRTFDEADAPQFPSGYAAMFLLALVPPLWFRTMDHRVDAWNAKAGAAA